MKRTRRTRHPQTRDPAIADLIADATVLALSMDTRESRRANWARCWECYRWMVTVPAWYALVLTTLHSLASERIQLPELIYSSAIIAACTCIFVGLLRMLALSFFTSYFDTHSHPAQWLIGNPAIPFGSRPEPLARPSHRSSYPRYL